MTHPPASYIPLVSFVRHHEPARLSHISMAAEYLLAYVFRGSMDLSGPLSQKHHKSGLILGLTCLFLLARLWKKNSADYQLVEGL